MWWNNWSTNSNRFRIKLKDILTFVNCVNIHKSMSELNKLDYKSYEIIANLINPIGWAGLVNFLGLFIFNKRDIK